MGMLAINGGNKVRDRLFPPYKVIGEEEKQAAIRVIESGVLSKYIGAFCDDFYGGPEVQALESEWASYYNSKHAISVNSATSALYCAIGAAAVGPGDEVIVCPYTMSASAISPLIYNAIPVFADIEKDYYCLDIDSIEKRITKNTKAIVIVDIFGLVYDVDKINQLAKKHNLLVIEDAAQAPGAKYGGKFAGTLGDIGIHSLNYHKHIHTGEGGIIVTDDDELATRMRLIRNHAEVVVEKIGHANLVDMLGFNYRMTEIEAAIARSQLKKLEGLLDERISNIKYMEKGLSQFDFLEMPKVRDKCEHSYYVHAIKYDESKADGIHRNVFIDAVRAELTPIALRESEGVKLNYGYTEPLYLQPLYQNLTAYGDKGCPFKCPMYDGKVNYEKGICPVCEDMHFHTLVTHEYMRPGISKSDMDDVVAAFEKVWKYRNEIKK